jgi:hypothetical protein
MYENAKESRVVKLLKMAWPFIYRLINSGFYWIMMTIKKSVAYAINQIKGTF